MKLEVIILSNILLLGEPAGLLLITHLNTSDRRGAREAGSPILGNVDT
ncbi:hypothetical protein [Microcoleus sp. FACHB-672]|nr:hypothetical protein [Microcoleus sp. FACHB-672]MBD2040634.1 hypothetical protein [Microcoleus sp. FACHB-672]